MSSITQHKVTLCWVVWRRMRLKFKEWQIWKQTPLCLMCGHIRWLHMKGIGHRCETCLAFMAVALNIQVTTQNGIMQSGQNMRSASSETVCVCLLVVKWNAKWTQLMTSGELHNPVWQSWRKFAKKPQNPVISTVSVHVCRSCDHIRVALRPFFLSLLLKAWYMRNLNFELSLHQIQHTDIICNPTTHMI